MYTHVKPGMKVYEYIKPGMKVYEYYLSRVMRKPAFCICENNDADQLRNN